MGAGSNGGDGAGEADERRRYLEAVAEAEAEAERLVREGRPDDAMAAIAEAERAAYDAMAAQVAELPSDTDLTGAMRDYWLKAKRMAGPKVAFGGGVARVSRRARS